MALRAWMLAPLHAGWAPGLTAQRSPLASACALLARTDSGAASSGSGLLLGRSLFCATPRPANQPISPAPARSAKTLATRAGAKMSWKIDLVPCLKDNYAYLLYNNDTKAAAIVDPSEAAPVAEAVQNAGLTLKHVMCTHHHWDHTGGNLDLKATYNAKVVGPAEDKERIPGIDIALKDGEVWDFDGLKVHVFHTPGHTRGHCSYYVPELEAVFTGDTLFSLGCGRLFEGTPAQMWGSLSRLAALPPATKVYCGHEYTASNAKFALSVEPSNAALKARAEEVSRLRASNQPTIPSTLQEELAANPFLRPQSEAVRASLKCPPSAGDAEVFGAMRKAKDGVMGALILAGYRLLYSPSTRRHGESAAAAPASEADVNWQ